MELEKNNRSIDRDVERSLKHVIHLKSKPQNSSNNIIPLMSEKKICVYLRTCVYETQKGTRRIPTKL